jgi:hypothetical protein
VREGEWEVFVYLVVFKVLLLMPITPRGWTWVMLEARLWW